MAIKKILIEVTERTVRETGKKFNSYKALMNNNKYIDVRFRQCVNPVPTQKCYIYVGDENMNINTTGKYPVLWVSAIEAIEEYEYANEKSKQFVTEHFDDADALPY